jgi:GT2 family glycosyltransferase
MISVVILAFNSAPFVTESVDSVLAAQGGGRVDMEILVLDNGSVDGTWDALGKAYRHDPRVRLMRSETGLGYAGGNNHAAATARGDLLLFLNDDCVVEEGCLDALVTELTASPGVGVLQCAVAVEDGSNWDTLGHFLDLWGFVHAMDADRSGALPPRRYPLFGASGAALAVRRALFEQLGGFDDRMQFLFEETDLCWRTLLSGAEVAGSVQAVVRHRQLARYRTALRRSAFYFETRNRIRGLAKNLEGRHAVEAVTVQVAARLGLALHRAARGDAGPLRDVVLAVWWNLANFRETTQRRRAMQRARLLSDQQLMARGLLRPRPALRDLGARLRGGVAQPPSASDVP